MSSQTEDATDQLAMNTALHCIHVYVRSTAVQFSRHLTLVTTFTTTKHTIYKFTVQKIME